MRHVQRRILVLAGRLAAVGIAALVMGCAGDDPSNPYRGDTPFVGGWNGTWATVGGSDSGTMTLTIGNDATMFGSFVNMGTGETGAIRGSTQPDGNMSFQLTTDGSGTVIPVRGIMQLVHPAGSTAVYLSSDGLYTRPGMPQKAYSFDLFTHAGSVPTTGGYTGTWSVPGTSDTGALNLVIGETGTMSGTFTDTGTGESGSVQGLATVNGSFVGAFVLNGTGERILVKGTVTAGSAQHSLVGGGTFTRQNGTDQGLTFSLS